MYTYDDFMTDAELLAKAMIASGNFEFEKWFNSNFPNGVESRAVVLAKVEADVKVAEEKQVAVLDAVAMCEPPFRCGRDAEGVFHIDWATDDDLKSVNIPASVTHVEIQRGKLTDLSPLTKFAQVESLIINNPQGPIDITPLSALSRLRTLEISGDGRVLKDINQLADLINLEELDISQANIDTIAPVTKLTKLKKLNLNFNPKIKDIQLLSELTKLEDLELSGNDLLDISFISGLTNLRRLDIQMNAVADLSPLAYLSNLRVLDVCENRISTIAPLSVMPQLTEVYVYNNQISDLMPLSYLHNLEFLDVGKNPVTDIAPLQNLVNMLCLCLDNTDVKDLRPLKTLTKMKEMHISDTKVSDVTALEGMTEMVRLVMVHTHCNAEDAKRIRAALPNCDITVGDDNDPKRLRMWRKR